MSETKNENASLRRAITALGASQENVETEPAEIAGFRGTKVKTPDGRETIVMPIGQTAKPS